MKKKNILLMALLMSSYGCASTMTPAMKERIVEAHIASAQKSTLDIECPAGCKVSYTDPRDRQINIPKETNGWDMGIVAIKTAAGLANAAIVPWVAVEGFKALKDAKSGDSITTTTTTTSMNTTGDTISYGDNAGDGSGSPVTTTSGDTISYSGNAGNNGHLYEGTSGHIGDDVTTNDSTHDPVVVPTEVVVVPETEQ